MFEKEVEIAKEYLEEILEDIDSHKDSFISPSKACRKYDYGNVIAATFSRANLITNPSTTIAYRIFISVEKRG